MTKIDTTEFLERVKRIDRRRTAGFVYFIQCEQFVKIGYSENPRWRPNSFATGNPFECRLIGLLEGGLDRERELHKQFADLRHRGEWFRLSDDLRAVIADLCGDWSKKARPTYEMPKVTPADFDFSHLLDHHLKT